MQMLVRGTGGPEGAAGMHCEAWTIHAPCAAPTKLKGQDNFCCMLACSNRHVQSSFLRLTDGTTDVAGEVSDRQHRGGLGQTITHHNRHPNGLQA